MKLHPSKVRDGKPPLRKMGEKQSLCASSCCPEAVFYTHGVEICQEPGEQVVWLSEEQAVRLAQMIQSRFGKAKKRRA